MYVLNKVDFLKVRFWTGGKLRRSLVSLRRAQKDDLWASLLIKEPSHDTRSRSLDIGQAIYLLIFVLSVCGPRRSRGTIFSHLDQTSLVNEGFTI